MALRLNHHAASVLLVVAIIAALLFSTLQHGDDWDGDAALYIMNARNIVSGHPYADTGYMFNPENAINPAAYPPGLPLLIAPVYQHSGIDIYKMKQVCLAAFILFLLVFAAIASEFLPPLYALAATITLGLHPYIWQFTDGLFSELPFMLFCYGALTMLERIAQETPEAAEKHRDYSLIWYSSASLLFAAAYLTRPIAIVLLPAAGLVSLLSTRRLLNATTWTLATAMALALLVEVQFHPDSGTYLGYFHDFSIRTPLHAAARYGSALERDFLQLSGSPSRWKDVVLLIFLVLAAWGLYLRLKLRFSVYEAFALGYCGFLLVYPITLEPGRYSMPIWPMLVLYALLGLQHLLAAVIPTGWRVGLQMIALAGVAGVYIQADLETLRRPLTYTVEAPLSEELFAAIRKDTPNDAGILARKPTIIALYTNRRSAIWPETFQDVDLWSFLSQYRIGYLVQDYGHFGVKRSIPDPLDEFISRNRSRLRMLFRNDWFALYSLSSG